MSKNIYDAARTGAAATAVGGMVREYLTWHGEGAGGGVEERKAQYATLVNHYYDLVTDFYEFGWGRSFHFAPRFKCETLAESLLRHEHYLALELGLRPGMRVLDVGCGVGGPARNIARFARVHVTGLNNNAYQVARARELTTRENLDERCKFLEGDFMAPPLPDEVFDAAYAIEATCHAPDRVGAFSEVYRVLRPGAAFAGYEWCLTDRFDLSDSMHWETKKGIEEGDGLPELTHRSRILDALRQAGFSHVTGRDLAGEGDPERPWYLPLSGRELTLSGLHRTKPGRFASRTLVRLLEAARLAPRGASAVSAILELAADALVRGGELGIFTPLYLFSARKPG
ncbi:MAG: methyltransferase domain-containing protein [bacterium]